MLEGPAKFADRKPNVKGKKYFQLVLYIPRDEMARLGVPDRFIDAFQGRIPRSVLARHYTDYSLENLKQTYEKAELKIIYNDD